MVSKIIEVSRDETEGDPVIDQLFEDFGIELMGKYCAIILTIVLQNILCIVEEDLGVQTIVAICCIYRLVPDPRIRVDLSKVVTFVDVSQIIHTSNNTACDDIQSRFHAIIILEF